mmetsp:Transcript_32722/g.77113  ORF Transcript_32722/g.77113 Transcript_32722/m.77113 type:complete len:433 (-) Transcript_32722:189-1487(-)
MSTAMQHQEERAPFLSELQTLFCSPIAGGSLWRTVYLFLALVLTGYFAYGIATAAPHWSDKVTDLSTEFREEMPFPEIYVCIPANVVRDLRSLPGQQPIAYVGGRPGNCDDGPAMVGVSLTEAPDDSKFKACPGKTFTSNTQNYQLSAATVEEDENAQRLAELLPRKGQGVDRSSAVCLVHKISDPTQTPTDKEKVGQISTWEVGAAFNDPIYFEVFFSQPRVPPFEGDGASGVLNASSAFLPGQGFMSIVDMTLTEITDKTQGHKETTWSIQPSVVPALGSEARVGPIDATHVFRWGSHIVTVVNIRHKTFSEVASEIGGLWAIVPAVLALLFMPTGRIDKRSQKEAFVFKWLPAGKINEFVRDLNPKHDDDIEGGRGVGMDPALAKKLDELLARMDAVDGGSAAAPGSLRQRLDTLQARLDAVEGMAAHS